jgi:hypothetical protein
MSAKAIREAAGKRLLARNLPLSCPGRDNLLVADYALGGDWEAVEAAHPFLRQKVRERGKRRGNVCGVQGKKEKKKRKEGERGRGRGSDIATYPLSLSLSLFYRSLWPSQTS